MADPVKDETEAASVPGETPRDAAPDTTAKAADDRGDSAFFRMREGVAEGSYMSLSPDETKARNKRNLAIAGGIVLFMVIVFFTTILRLTA